MKPLFLSKSLLRQKSVLGLFTTLFLRKFFSVYLGLWTTVTVEHLYSFLIRVLLLVSDKEVSNDTVSSVGDSSVRKASLSFRLSSKPFETQHVCFSEVRTLN